MYGATCAPDLRHLPAARPARDLRARRERAAYLEQNGYDVVDVTGGIARLDSGHPVERA